ncbi:MAG: UDP-N-acetylmuramoyl-L-alanine--D-glutamate ligase [Bifidobacteriaceae bacterium]|nr:UDP-N-acetylmuramoyl-L-alanine--D-glutamate ligase [Bifidobacteriaceae bacterium]
MALDIAGATVAVLGLGASGRAAARTLIQAGAQIIPVDDAATEPVEGIAPIKGEQLDLAGIDLIVTSPGWPPWRPPLAEAVSAGIEIWSEVELAWRTRAKKQAPWLCVTGTNGKTTTVELTAAILQAAGLNAVAAGNIGQPLVEAVSDESVELFVCELSSFQLHFTSSIKPWAAALLNVAPDHLDWHGSQQDYWRDKARIADGAFLCVIVGPQKGLTEAVHRWGHPGRDSRILGVTLGEPADRQIGVVDGAIVDRAWADGEVLAQVSDLAHLATPRHGGAPGLAPRAASAPPDHLVLDALTAMALVRSLPGVEPPAIAKALTDFAVGEHRMSLVGQIDAADYFDDSKATNPHAVQADLAGFGPRSVVWVAGGLTKGTDIEELVRGIVGKLRGVVLIGRDTAAFAGPLGRHAPGLPVVEVPDGETDVVMSRAVQAARRMASGAAAVVLAPAAASQDQFTSYAERGQAFAQAVRAESARAEVGGQE